MKKLLLLITCFVFTGSLTFGGGIVTNSNQSAYWVRSLARDASTGPDAVYFNPAGLTRMEDGFHFSLNSQTIFQNKDVENNYMYLSPTPKMFKGDTKVPVFPSLYAIWKKNKIAISFGFSPIGGGGGATFEGGLPVLELGSADIGHILSAYGATDYRQDVYFKGSSVYFGYQLGVTYQITDVISAYLGARYVSVKNTYEGHLRDVEVNMGGNWVNVSTAFTNLATQATAGAAGATSISGTMGDLITAGLPAATTLAQAESGGYITATQRAQLEGGLTALGINATQGIGGIQTACNATATALTGQAAQATATAGATSVLFNQEAEVEQKGSGIAPILGVNFAFDKLNIGLKYEFKTVIEVENDTKSDFIVGLAGATPVTMFPDGEKVHNDLPAMMSIGAEYKITPKFSAAAGLHYYWDKGVSYGKTLNGVQVDNDEIIDDNYLELSLGLEYGISEKLFASAGYLHANTGVSKDYQSDISFSLTSNTFGGGLGYKITDKIMVNLGVAYTAYIDETKDYQHTFSGTATNIPLSETYFKNNLIMGIGLDLSF